MMITGFVSMQWLSKFEKFASYFCLGPLSLTFRMGPTLILKSGVRRKLSRS